MDSCLKEAMSNSAEIFSYYKLYLRVSMRIAQMTFRNVGLVYYQVPAVPGVPQKIINREQPGLEESETSVSQ